ncbi:MAG: 3-phosphoglycerate dehydrogenase, partial [Firmicutes bacterium]|nr:3-phosphoglycerate dehydrogenase [Bacillota bacterium]
VKRGIAVINCPVHNAEAVAEYTIGLMIAETRNISRSHCSLKNGVWREGYPNSDRVPELNSSTIGLIGFGTIGKLVAKKLKGFNAKIMVSDPYLSNKVIRNEGGIPVDLNTLLKESDIVSLHSRLTDSTKHMIGQREFGLMKSSAYFINTARAGLVDMNALRKVLSEKRIAGAALDVYENEPVTREEPLFELDNVTVTNHRGGDTLNSYWKAPLILKKQVEDFFNEIKPDFLVNFQMFST